MTDKTKSDADDRKKSKGFRLFKATHKAVTPHDLRTARTVAVEGTPKDLIVVTKNNNNHTNNHARQSSVTHSDRWQHVQSQRSKGFFAALGRTVCKTKAFRDMCDKVFDAIDVDDSGTIDEKELYSGMLLMHLKLGMYAGAPACARPLDRERCREFFQRLDVDGSGELDRNEFREVMIILFSNVLLRVLFMCTATILLVPLLSRSFLNATNFMTQQGTHVFHVAQDKVHQAHTPLLSKTLELTQTTLRHSFFAFITAITYPIPYQFKWLAKTIVQTMSYLLSLLPESVWSSLPLTLVSTMLSVIAVPWTLLRIDSFFFSVAEQKSKSFRRKIE